MSTLALIATSTVTGVIGAAAMYLPARLARYDAATYRDLAERKLDECEARDAAYEESRTLQPFWSFDAPHELPAAADHEGEVLHVEHPTGEIHIPAAQFDDLIASIDDADLAPRLSRLADEVVLAQALSDRPAEDELCESCGRPWRECAESDDIVGDEQPGEAWFAGVARQWRRLVASLRSLWSKPDPYRGRHWVEGTVHTGTWPIVIPEQRAGGEE